MTHRLDLDLIDSGGIIELPHGTKSIRIKDYPSIVQLQDVVLAKDGLQPYLCLSDMTVQYDERRSKEVSQERDCEIVAFLCSDWREGGNKFFYLYLPIIQLTNKKLNFPMSIDTGERFCYTYNLLS